MMDGPLIREQEISYMLLIELLVHQFCSPVRWIETQDHLLARSRTQRIIEIGPAETLTHMMKQTIARKYQKFDSANSLQRELYSSKKNNVELYFDYPPSTEEDTEEKQSVTVSAKEEQEKTEVIAEISIPSLTQKPLQEPVTLSKMHPDAAIKASEVVKLLVAQALRKEVLEIPDDRTIKQLANGRSTLQNEIIGDLSVEFERLPEYPENLALEQLCNQIQEGFSGKLGPKSGSLIARLVSSKLPGSCTLAAVRKHLLQHWGLGPGRQDSVLVMAASSPPQARLTTEIEMKNYLDGLALQFATSAGLGMDTQRSDKLETTATIAVVDRSLLDQLQEGQRAINKKLFAIYAKSLDMSLKPRGLVVPQVQLDSWSTEHDDIYTSGIKPIFNFLHARTYNSYWNWALQDLHALIHDIIQGRAIVGEVAIEQRISSLLNRSNSRLLSTIQYHEQNIDSKYGSRYLVAKEFLLDLARRCEAALVTVPMFRSSFSDVGPLTTISEDGRIRYTEIPRADCCAASNVVTLLGEKTHHDPAVMSRTVLVGNEIPGAVSGSDLTFHLLKNLKDPTRINSQILIEQAHLPPSPAFLNDNNFSQPQTSPKLSSVQIFTKTRSEWHSNPTFTSTYIHALDAAKSSGLTFEGKNVLVTGCGSRSIGGEIVQGLLSGGAKVIVTSSSYSSSVAKYFQNIYAQFGARGSELVLVPFNQGSRHDVEKLIEFVYDSKTGLGWDLDCIVPFAAISEKGIEIDNLGSRSELAHRIMLTNLLRLLGEVKRQKEAHRVTTRPAQVILPLSPNHGIFGGDGLYSESKIALEAVFAKWSSESWSEYLSLCGVNIGWTRGTGLMADNDLVSFYIEEAGLQTFSREEMASNILALMTDATVFLADSEPITADLSGGMNKVANLKELVSNIRKHIHDTSSTRKAIAREQAIVLNETSGSLNKPAATPSCRANFKLDFPSLSNYGTVIEPLSQYRKGMVDLDKVVVVVGFAEVGPLGNSRTRWEIESSDELSLEGCIEMAWIMGLIKYQQKPIRGKSPMGWMDARTGEPVADAAIKERYGKYIRQHSGIRFLENDSLNGDKANSKQFLQEVVTQEDLEPFEATREVALDFQREHGDKAVIIHDAASDSYSVQLKQGASIWIAKASSTGRLVGGQVPKGWDPKTYGISEDIITQVSTVTLYTLICTVEALLSAGITDAFEIYQFIHVSEMGNFIGGGMGGMESLDKMMRQRFLEAQIQNDIFQETFINTPAAWVNMLLMSSSGTTVTPVAACATALESLHVGYESIVNGNVKACLVGGTDDMNHTSIHEFRSMKATIDVEADIAHGREPHEMSRPTTSTRAGFVESEGAGIQLLTTARLALDMGLPIRAVVAYTNTAMDKIGRSIPAPGAGLLTSVVDAPTKYPSPLLDMRYRQRNLNRRLSEIQEQLELEKKCSEEERSKYVAQGFAEEEIQEYLEERMGSATTTAEREKKDALNTFGNQFWKGNTRIAPIRGALATWGLAIDDLSVASFHGTSTKKNEANETRIVNEQMCHLGRTTGNPMLGVFQKSLTGHPKGPAAAWMLNGCMQIMEKSIVPGNRNADNIDLDLAQYEHVFFPNRSLQMESVNAFSVTCFGFGQKNAQAIGVHPKFLFATVEKTEYEAYQNKCIARQRKADQYFHQGLVTNRLFVAKQTSPYPESQMFSFLTSAQARLSAPDTTITKTNQCILKQ